MLIFCNIWSLTAMLRVIIFQLYFKSQKEPCIDTNKIQHLGA